MTAATAANAIMTIMREFPTGTKTTEVDSERERELVYVGSNLARTIMGSREIYEEIPALGLLQKKDHEETRAIIGPEELDSPEKFNRIPKTANHIFRLSVVLLCILCGLAWYQRTINMWALKNIGDTFLTKDIVSHATVQRIHRGKRASSDICSWAGHIAECELEVHTFKEFRIGTTPDVEDAMIVTLEQPLREPRHDLVVCMAPMYIYTDWETLLVGIETWLALGATKIIVPVQSASTSSYKILREYEKRGAV
ncbi:hypothetical protein TELCIR_15704 [Teladorsagia circumcincta]|uniref:Glycosyltransferase family 92 protein n=1 Tax=Teladorsagia circumcincta TaxID=45464 RepID=A0A2G9TXM5_TELCI|nr:hypothetical protein TELCIR_15704 [Teladorsagia circumcincta]